MAITEEPPILIDGLNEHDYEEAEEAAAKALSRSGTPSPPALIDGLNEHDYEEAEEAAAKALSRSGTPSPPALIDGLNEHDYEEAEEAAAAALSRTATPPPPVLIDGLNEHDYDEAKDAAEQAAVSSSFQMANAAKTPTTIDGLNKHDYNEAKEAATSAMRARSPIRRRASTPDSDDIVFETEKQYYPGQPVSLSGIAMRSFVMGLVFSASALSAVYIIAFTASPLWRPLFFLTSLSLFHFLEFWTTARYNTRKAKISSFLLTQNGAAYKIAHSSAMLETIILGVFFPKRHWLPTYFSYLLIAAGAVLVIVGQLVRSLAMSHAGSSFNHIVQRERQNDHVLVTTGIYAFLRHPSYFGFFWWGLGTQLVLGNLICFFGYAGVLWMFFNRRIKVEERELSSKKFFGDEYTKYRANTIVGIPGIA